MKSPEPADCLAVHQLEDSLLSVAPLDEFGAALLVLDVSKISKLFNQRIDDVIRIRTELESGKVLQISI